MKNIKYIKEPGYIYDLFFLFVLHFNKDFCLTNFINYNQSAEDTEYFNKIENDFNDISEELFLFFYLKENNSCLMTKYYYRTFSRYFTTTYNLETVQSALRNTDEVISNLIKYYFMDSSEAELNECKRSVTAMGRLIRDSSYNDKLKSHLYSFLLEPAPFIQKLSYELMKNEFAFSQFYNKNNNKVTEFQGQIDIQDLTNKLKLCKGCNINIEPFDDIYISICLVAKNCIQAHFNDNKLLLLLGSDSLNHLDYLTGQNYLPDLNIFGTALSEVNRIDILNLMLEKEEITIKDIEQELAFTGTNAYYHLSLMIKAGMIKTRNQGRTVLYSINKHYFDLVCKLLNKYSNNSLQERR